MQRLSSNNLLEPNSNNRDNHIFYIEGFYTKVIKDMFGCLAKYSQNTQADFHILVNMASMAFVTKGRGNITSTVLQLKDQFFTQLIFNENQSNTAAGYVLKVNMSDFDLCYKLLDPGAENKIIIEYERDSANLVIKQNNKKDEQHECLKIIKLAIVEETQEEKDAISLSFIPDLQYPIMLEFPNGTPFKLVEKAFGCLKLEILQFHFDFSDPQYCKFFIESDQSFDEEFFKVTLNKFKKLKGDQEFRYSYAGKLVLPAFAFLTKETEISLKVDENGTLILVSQDTNANISTETIIPTVVDTSN